MFTNYPMLPTCNRKLVPKLHSAALLNAVQHSTEALPHGNIHTDTHPCACVSWQGPQATEGSIEVLKFVGGKSSLLQSTSSRTNAAHPALPRPGFGARDKHLGRTTWKCKPFASDQSGARGCQCVQLSSSCLLVLYCTSFACSYSQDRTDSSSGGTTTVNKTTQANSLLNICSL